MKPDIIAQIKLYPTEQGGRKGPTPTDRFGCLFLIDGKYFDCRLLLDGIGSLVPGQTATVPIKFLSPEAVKDHLKLSPKFKLWDGKAVADGEVQEIIK